MKSVFLCSIALSCLSFVHVSAQAAPNLGADSAEKIMVVDRSGKPPFKRVFVAEKTVDVAQFETISQGECEVVKTVTMRGKPPFKRSQECVLQVDVAQFEITSEQPKTDFSGKPPFTRR